jgi:hypothetical protein
MAKKALITQGENAVFTIKLRDEEGDPFDLTAYDKFSVCMPKSDGDTLEVTEVANANGSIVTVLGDALLGKLQVAVKSGDTSDLLADERLDIGVKIDVAASPDPRIKTLKNVLTVEENPC